MYILIINVLLPSREILTDQDTQHAQRERLETSTYFRVRKVIQLRFAPFIMASGGEYVNQVLL